jgi:hypothetical protein
MLLLHICPVRLATGATIFVAVDRIGNVSGKRNQLAPLAKGSVFDLNITT